MRRSVCWSAGLVGAALGLGFVAGPAIGGISSTPGDAAPGLVASGLSAINLAMAWRWLPESRPSVTSLVGQGGRVHWSRYLLGFSAVSCSTLAFAGPYVVFPLQLERALGYDRHHSAYFFVLIGVVSPIVQGGLIGRWVGRFGERVLIGLGGVVMAAGLGLLPAVMVLGGATSAWRRSVPT